MRRTPSSDSPFCGASSAECSTKSGLQEYLILLSVRETLRRKSISFLKFLRAREPDLNVFLERV